jgi:light-regulated signal transduction histidine kinase (bacteriophytochrome)
MHPMVDLVRPCDDPEYLGEQRRVDVIRARIAARTVGIVASALIAVTCAQTEGFGSTYNPVKVLRHNLAPLRGARKGTGLGLAISYQIVQRHGGRIELDERYRSGARFVVSLPIDGTRKGN